jgi:hypothetical protein
MADTDITPPKPPSTPGLINSVAEAPAPAPAPALSSGALGNLSQVGLSQSDIDTSGRVAALKDPNSALMKQATGNVNMDYARRGLLNSSAAAQSADEAMTSKALEIVNPDIDRLVGIARGNADNAAAMAREQASVAGQTSIANLNNSAAMERQKSQLSAADAQQLRDLQSRRDIAQLQIDADKSNTAQNLANNLKLLDAQTEKSLQLADANAGRALQDSYRTSSQATYDSYLRDVQAIQTSPDMDAETKQAQITNLNQLYTQRQKYVNTLYQAVPGWHSEWSQLAVEFGGNGG